MIVHVVMGTTGGGYDEWPDAVVCGVFLVLADAQKYLEAERAKQTAHSEWRSRCSEEKQRLKPSRLQKRQMTEEQRQAARERTKQLVLDAAGPEPQCSEVSYFDPVAMFTDRWHPNGADDLNAA